MKNIKTEQRNQHSWFYYCYVCDQLCLLRRVLVEDDETGRKLGLSKGDLREKILPSEIPSG